VKVMNLCLIMFYSVCCLCRKIYGRLHSPLGRRFDKIFDSLILISHYFPFFFFFFFFCWLIYCNKIMPVGSIGRGLPIQVEFLKSRSELQTYLCL
jgi:hypothetical protein